MNQTATPRPRPSPRRSRFRLGRCRPRSIATADFPTSWWLVLSEAGLLRATMPREVGRAGAGARAGAAVRRSGGARRHLGGMVRVDRDHQRLLVAYLPESSRDEMFGGGRGVAAGVWAPRGTARSVDGGVVVSGRWPFCSGINHADMMFAGCFIDDQRVPSVVAIPKDDLQVLDTWHTLGLRGTGSHDSVADEVFVPADRVLSVFDGPTVDRPLYRFPVFGFFALCIGAAALGNARAAIDDLVELAGGKKGLGSTRTLAERPATQAAVATAEAALGAARALYYESIDAAWQASQEAELRCRRRCATGYAWRPRTRYGPPPTWCATCMTWRGGSAIYDSSPLQRRFRDAFTATAHFQVNEASRELPGRVLLDQPADVSML